MNRTRRMLRLLAIGLLCGMGLGARVAPVLGSALPDAWGTAGSKVVLSVPEVAGKPVTISGTMAPSAGERVTVTIPLRTPPGRLRVQFINDSTQQTITTRDIEVLAPETLSDPRARRVQLLISPKLTPQQVDALLARLLPNVGTLNSRETLPAPVSSPKTTGASPCGGTLAEIQLGAGITLEAALNLLAQQGSDDVWYPDPISSWGIGALTQTSSSQTQSGQAHPQLPGVEAQAQQSFNYASAPVLPRVVLGSPAGGLTGTGVTIAVLDTGFSPQLDPTHELTDAQGNRLPRVLPPVNALVPYDPANPAPSLAGSQDFWEGHGTQVAMLAAGALSGAAPGAGVLPIKVCSPGENGRASCSTKDVLRGLCVALNRVPAQQLVINLSLGGAAPTGAIHAVLNWAQLQGAVVVAAGGNQHQASNTTDPEEYPAAFARSHAPSQAALPILAVASTTPTADGGRSLNASSVWPLSPFSTRGSYLSISAPGDLLDLGHVQLYSGTSFASPLVAGAAALARQANPNLTPAALRTFVLSGGRVIGALPTPAATTNQAAPTPGLPMLRLSGY